MPTKSQLVSLEERMTAALEGKLGVRNQYRDIQQQVQNLLDELERTPEPAASWMAVGGGMFLQAQPHDLRRIVLLVGANVYVDLTVEEAAVFLHGKKTKLQEKISLQSREIDEIKQGLVVLGKTLTESEAP
ncbi:hypothetical protein HDU91_005332 [Kappamyces sp. JEL0680]|nr:hypothetical protein HDU91_005332 [Kappamyces sp. JEL0680]